MKKLFIAGLALVTSSVFAQAPAQTAQIKASQQRRVVNMKCHEQAKEQNLQEVEKKKFIAHCVKESVTGK